MYSKHTAAIHAFQNHQLLLNLRSCSRCAGLQSVDLFRLADERWYRFQRHALLQELDGIQYKTAILRSPAGAGCCGKEAEEDAKSPGFSYHV